MKIIPTLLVILFVASSVRAEPPVRLERVFAKLNLHDTVFLTCVPDGSDRVVVLEQSGRVLVFDNKDDVAAYDVALDIRHKVQHGGEEGLLGLAFHPKFKENGQVFLHYTAKPGLLTTVSRFTMDAPRKIIKPESEEIIFTLKQPWRNHNGGMIAFSPTTTDGLLYLALGDGGYANDPLNSGQNRNSLLGKILRLDVDHTDAGLKYAIPKDNPFVNDKDARGEIWAYGLRNPWRFSFDRETGDLWAGDVGQDKWEEVDLITKGGNYGWRLREGKHDHRPVPLGPKDLIEPIVEHGHAESKCVTGGYVYHGKKIPGLQGAYIYGDYVTGLIWALSYDPRHPEKPPVDQYIVTGQQIASFGEDRDGEIYVVSLGGWIFRLVSGEVAK